MQAIARLKGHRGRVNCVDFGVTSALSGSSDCQAIVWRLLGHGASVHSVLQHSRPIVKCKLVHGDQIAVTCCYGSNKDTDPASRIYVWNLRDPVPILLTIYDDVQGAFREVVSDGEVGFIVNTCSNSYIFKIVPDSGILYAENNSGGEDHDEGSVTCNALSCVPNSQGSETVISSDHHAANTNVNEVCVSTIVSKPVRVKPSTTRAVFDRVQFDEDDEQVFVSLKSTDTTREQVTVLTGQTRLTSVVYHSRSKLLCSSGVDGSVKTFDLSLLCANPSKDRFVWAPRATFDSHSCGVNQVSLSADGTLALTASDDCTLFLIDLFPDERRIMLAFMSCLFPRLGSNASCLLKMMCQQDRVRRIFREMLL